MVSVFARGDQDAFIPLTFDEYQALRQARDVFAELGAIRESQKRIEMAGERTIAAVAEVTPEVESVLRSAEAQCMHKADLPSRSEPGLVPTTPLFITQRKGTHEDFCILVIKALAAIGPDARLALPELRLLLDIGNGTAQLMAGEALKQIDPTATD